MKTGILFVHGIQGSPAQFRFLIERLPEDIRVRNLLLSGHGAAGVVSDLCASLSGTVATHKDRAKERRSSGLPDTLPILRNG